MSRRGALAAVLVAALALGLLGARAALATNECNGIRECQRVVGPWVVVPARGIVSYLVDCPRRRGIVGGLDAVASSSDIHVWFDGQLGGPVGPGRTTTRYAFFHALSAKHRPGAFEPLIGCIPTESSRSTTSAWAVPGPPLVLAATTLPLRPGLVRTVSIGCVPGQKLVDSWHTLAFRTPGPPNAGLVAAVDVRRTTRGKKVAVTIVTSEALPRGTGAEVQLGVMCSTS